MNHAGPVSFAWYRLYGGLLGLPAEEFWAMPFGDLLDLISCYRLMHGWAKEKKRRTGRISEQLFPDCV